MKKKGRMLVIDDEPSMQEVLKELLKDDGYEVTVASSGNEGLHKLEQSGYDLVICDVMMPDMNGLQTLEEIKKLEPEQMVIMITAYGSVEDAISAIKGGAFDYITRPYKNEVVLNAVRRAIQQRYLIEENINLRSILKKYRFEDMVGKNKMMQDVFKLILQVAPSKSTVLIEGESGTGKELVATAIHQNSSRTNKSFVVVNCGTVPADLLESNLFGHVKGAYTGAISSKRGLFEIADGGSIFFDEIGNINLETQAKLLRVMQEKKFMRLGGVDNIQVDVRIIAATNKNLNKMLDSGEFREDLFYRLNVINIKLPTLRERKDDIPLLVSHFLQKYCQENNKRLCHITPEAMAYLWSYHWPGNVRELENTIERAVVLSTSNIIGKELLPDYIINPTVSISYPLQFPSDSLSFKDMVHEFEKKLVLNSLKMANGVQKKAAELLKIKPTTFSEMLKRLNIANK
ncbi:MAG: sigma-54 dependent transcriptional regulator [Candidatus Aminicenantes bacterium]|nr:sigma-54 dependent transcriptional regulator [Candidatus Aminicenantes bacterium]